MAGCAHRRGIESTTELLFNFEVDLDMFVNEGELIPSLSCGVAIFPANGKNAEDLLAAADSALYVAKKKGKNQVAFAV